MKQPTKADLLDEIRRLRAENKRLTRLSETQRPELALLRAVEVGLRDIVNNWPQRLTELHAQCQDMCGGYNDLPTLEELRGFIGPGPRRVNKALQQSPEMREGEEP